MGDTDTYPTASSYSDYIELFPTVIVEDEFGNPLICDIDGDGIPNTEDPDMDGEGRDSA